MNTQILLSYDIRNLSCWKPQMLNKYWLNNFPHMPQNVWRTHYSRTNNTVINFLTLYSCKYTFYIHVLTNLEIQLFGVWSVLSNNVYLPAPETPSCYNTLKNYQCHKKKGAILCKNYWFLSGQTLINDIFLGALCTQLWTRNYVTFMDDELWRMQKLSWPVLRYLPKKNYIYICMHSVTLLG